MRRSGGELDDNFNYSNNPIQKYPGTKVEFSLISKEPLYFDSYVAVACGPDKRGEHIRPLICNFETLKTEIKQSSNEISMPNLRFVLVDHGGDKVESNVYQSELWPIILKGFEQLIRNSHISTIEAKNINNKRREGKVEEALHCTARLVSVYVCFLHISSNVRGVLF